ncbi:MAG TPA: GNAT family N-acetyltransferase [Actinomycetota bacterium]
MAKRWTWERGAVWELELTGGRIPLVAPAVPARWEEAGPDGAEELASAMGLPEPGEVLRRLAGGARAFAARVAPVGGAGGRIVCYGWVSAGSEWIGELERAIRLGPGEAYVWDCLTAPEHRRLGLYTALLGHIARTLQAEGFGRLWIGSALGNRPSIRGFEAAGFRPVLRVAYVRAGAATVFVTRSFPRVPRGRAAAARAALARDGEHRAGPLSVGRLRHGPGKLPWSTGADL